MEVDWGMNWATILKSFGNRFISSNPLQTSSYLGWNVHRYRAATNGGIYAVIPTTPSHFCPKCPIWRVQQKACWVWGMVGERWPTESNPLGQITHSNPVLNKRNYNQHYLDSWRRGEFYWTSLSITCASKTILLACLKAIEAELTRIRRKLFKWQVNVGQE